jgi:hypothetical protein
LSQPPIITTASIGCARIISSVSMDMRLRRYIAGGMREAFVDGDRREVHRQSAGEHHAALHRLDELRRVAVAGIERAARIDDANDRTRERVVRVARALDERLAQEKREAAVAVAREALLETLVFFVGHGFVPR